MTRHEVTGRAPCVRTLASTKPYQVGKYHVTCPQLSLDLWLGMSGIRVSVLVERHSLSK
jgi:hypothetical protein